MKFVLIKSCKLIAGVFVLGACACWIRMEQQELSATKLVAVCTVFQHQHSPFPMWLGVPFLNVSRCLGNIGSSSSYIEHSSSIIFLTVAKEMD